MDEPTETETETAYVEWTGHNLDEVESFARGHGFGLTVGSNFYSWRWWHHAYSCVAERLCGLVTLPDWEPPEDHDVLEIYPTNSHDDVVGRWTTARPGDRIFAGGHVMRAEGP